MNPSDAGPCSLCGIMMPTQKWRKQRRCAICTKTRKYSIVIAYRKQNPESVKKWASISHKRSVATDKRKAQRRSASRTMRSTLKGRLTNTIRARMSTSLRGAKARRPWDSLIGYSINDLKLHLEQKFDQHMTWANYGTYWHIDHIVPISSFVYSSPDDSGFQECWALANLQPLEKKRNQSKSNRVGEVNK